MEWTDKRQAQLDRLVELREKLWLEELELAKADAVASLEAAAAEEIKLHREWVNGRIVVTAPEEPISELEAHLTGAFEANSSKAEVSRPTKMVGEEPSKIEKTMMARPKIKPLVTKAPAVAKVARLTNVENKEESDQNVVQETKNEPHMKESEPEIEGDQVMVDAEINGAEQKAEHAAEGEALENPEGSMAEDEELYGEDEEFGDDEYLEELPEEVMKELEKERKEEMAKFENDLKVGKTKVKFGDFDEVNAMVITLPLFFEARPDQPNYVDGDVFDEVESMVQMNGAKEIEVAREIPKEENAQPCTMVTKAEEKVPEKVCYEMPTKKMSSHLKPLYVGAHFDGISVSKVLVDTGATINILPASIMRKLKKGSDELIPTETTVSGFVEDTTASKGIIPLQVRVGQKVRMTAFFVVETTAHFNALLGRDWIHGSMCVPSSLHQFLQFWHEDGSVESV